VAADLAGCGQRLLRDRAVVANLARLPEVLEA
jgi:hypothetical protein